MYNATWFESAVPSTPSPVQVLLQEAILAAIEQMRVRKKRVTKLQLAGTLFS